jgi:hypothetical protein
MKGLPGRDEIKWTRETPVRLASFPEARAPKFHFLRALPVECRDFLGEIVEAAVFTDEIVEFREPDVVDGVG